MDSEFQDIEDSLKTLRPAAPDAACMERLLAAATGRLQQHDPSIERDLAGMRPQAVSTAVAERLLAAVARVPFPLDEKVVLFPGSAKPAAKAPVRRPWFAAAAAVAVAGAFSALMVDRSEAPAAGAVATQVPARANVARTGFVPASLVTGLQDAKDDGVRWTDQGRPVRKVRVIYMDRLKCRNERGEIFEVERPRVQYLEIPEKID